jgi:hypothetical protein
MYSMEYTCFPYIPSLFSYLVDLGLHLLQVTIRPTEKSIAQSHHMVPNVVVEWLTRLLRSFSCAGDRTPVVESVVRHCVGGQYYMDVNPLKPNGYYTYQLF